MTIYTRPSPPDGFYVYAYLRDDGSPYYIGKGEKLRAWKPHRRRNGADIVPKDKTKIVILYHSLTELWSVLLERKLIRWYGRKDLGTGILVNLTDGGEGVSGRKASDLQKERVSKSNKGKKPSENTIRLSIIGRKKALTGKPRPSWVKDKLRKPKPQVQCPHCDAVGGASAMHRWHFSNCKSLI